MTPAEYRIRAVPGQLERARVRYLHLLREADRLGLKEIINDTDKWFLIRSNNGTGKGKS